MGRDPRDVDDLRRRLDEAEETLRAIRAGEIDALVVAGHDGERVFTLQGADHPYRVLIEAMQQGAATLAADGTVLYCNRRFADLLGRPAERVVGAAAVGLLPPAHRPAFLGLLAAAGAGAAEGEAEFEFPGGDRLPVHLTLSPLPAGGAAAVCLIATDLTEAARRRALEVADRRKDEFLAMLAHELRNPLAPIRNALHALAQPGLPAGEGERMRAVAERQVGQMARLLDDLLDMARIGEGKVDLRVEPLDLGRLAGRAAESVRPTAEGRGHTLTTDLPADPLPVAGDPARLEQVVVNLLTNACKYTDPGGHIRLSLARDGAEAVLRVRDDGTGIAPDMLPRVFELFVQAERRLDRSQGGIGIGLTLVRRLVELHGGTVTAHSDGLGRGTEFVVRLPLAVPEAEEGRRGGAEERSQDRALIGSGLSPPLLPSSPPPLRVLVVDDNPDAADSLALVLRVAGQEVRTAYDGPTALTAADAFRPAVVLLDIGMPGMDGYQTAAELRKKLPEVRLVALTGWGQEDDRRRGRDAGFDHHLVKPADPAAVLAVLANGAG